MIWYIRVTISQGNVCTWENGKGSGEEPLVLKLGWQQKKIFFLQSSSATQAKEGKLYAICEIPIKPEEGETTQRPQDTTTVEASTATPGKNETSEISDKGGGFFITDEVLISLALIQLPAVILAFLGIINAFHKYGCSCQGLRHVVKASLLIFIPFFAIELIGSVFELIGLCLGLVPCSRMIRNLHRVSLSNGPIQKRDLWNLRFPIWLAREIFTSRWPSTF